MGTVDRAKKFHPMIYACSSHERAEYYTFEYSEPNQNNNFNNNRNWKNNESRNNDN